MKKAFLSILAAIAAVSIVNRAAADETSASNAQDKQFVGKIEYINGDEHAITVKGWVRHRTFDLGNNCAIVRWDKTTGALGDLRRGENVLISFKNVHGVLAADRVEEQVAGCKGIVKSIEPSRSRLVMMRHLTRDKTFDLPGNCRIVLHDQQSGGLESIKPGDHVTVIYQILSGPEVARQIDRSSTSFTGSVVSVDLQHRAVSAKGMFGVKQFSLANDCSVVMNGRLEAPLTDLRPHQRLNISYDEINGVNIANRISPADNAGDAATAKTNP